MKRKYRKTLIVTGGSIDRTFALDYITGQDFDYFIASDSGIHFFDQIRKAPDEIVGDFDSADPGVLEKFRQNPRIIFHEYPPEKDAADTELALQLAMARGSSEIHILGGTGTRLDHLLGTVRLLGMAMEQGIACFLVDPNNKIRLIQGRTVLKKAEQYGDYVSLIPLTAWVDGVTLTGFQYPLKNYRMDGYHTVGISNEIVDEEAVVDFTDGVMILIEARD